MQDWGKAAALNCCDREGDYSMSKTPIRCMCGDPECPSCGRAQGTYPDKGEEPMSKKPDPRIEVFQTCGNWMVRIVCDQARVYFGSRSGTCYWSHRTRAYERAKWWADKLGLPVVEVKG